ncbi:hypothetical protein PN441_10765 [Spirulina major CS-329]|nr:hypothetical protein [Spirulina subsalsa]MDB9493215.1 hypothetical protein [Spirulina subsalsa CS-330]MDB9503552.1 hypothetical protein [Spirulina major CS-329]
MGWGAIDGGGFGGRSPRIDGLFGQMVTMGADETDGDRVNS